MNNVQGAKQLYSGLRVVHVSPTYPPALGGMENVVQNLAGMQASMGADVAVISSDIGTGTVPNDPFSVTRLKSFVFANTTIMPGLFFKLLRVPRGSVVHVHVTQAFTPEMVWLASKVKRFRYVAHIHLDVPPSGPAGFLLKLYKPLVLKRVLHKAAYVVVFTEEQKAVFHKKYALPNDKVQVVINGVKDTFYFDTLRHLAKKPKLLFVGRLGYQKNIPQLFHALQGVSDTFETVLVGSGELESELKQLAQELHLKNVTFAGRKDGAELLQHFKDADVFVLPSEREGMPLVLLEAMAMGLPIVATDVTGNRDVVVNEQTGLLVPLNNVDALREALIAIAANPAAYERMSKTARKMADKYSWEVVATEFAKLYRGAKR